MASLPEIEKVVSSLATEEVLPAPPEPAYVPDPKYPSQGPLYSDTETYSRQILGKTSFELYCLLVYGTKGNPPYPWNVGPNQSPFIVDDDAENMVVGLCMQFDHSPLTRLLLCLGVNISAKFHFEGIGGHSAEKDLKVTIKSQEGQFRYWIGELITPEEVGLTPGYYLVAATVEVGPITHKCGQYVFGYGYIGERRLQVAKQPNF
jgi:hypothetical protein